MFNLQGSEIIFILLLALVFLGPEKLPDAVRRFTRTYGELRKMGSGFQSELRSVLDEPVREARETAGLLRDAADPDKIADAGSTTPLAAETSSSGAEEAPDPGAPPGPVGGPDEPAAVDAPRDTVAAVAAEAPRDGADDDAPSTAPDEARPGADDDAPSTASDDASDDGDASDDAARRRRAART